MSVLLEPALAELGLRALKSVACADGRFDQREQVLLEAAARALHIEDCDVGALQSLTPEELAERVTDDAARERFVQAQMVMALIDGEIDKSELEIIRAFSKALGVSEPRLKNLKQLLSAQHKLLKLDLSRHSSMIDDAVRQAYRERGLRGAWATVAPLLSKSLGNDEELAWRYRKLGLLPEGTFGREYWAHMRERGFSFPGEPTGFPEVLIKHDCCHVLGGYDTDPAGECEVVAFICGFMKRDPFWYLFMILVHMHLGIETFHNNELGKWAFDPDRAVAAFLKGRQVSVDLYEPGYDWWQHFDKPLQIVRRELGISE